MPEQTYPPRRRKRRPNYTPLIIVILAAILAVLGIVALIVSQNDGQEPSASTAQTPAASTAPSAEQPQDTTGATDPEPTEPEVPQVTLQSTATFTATGDMLMHMPCVRPAKQSDGSYDFTPYFENIKYYISAADYAVANLETTLAGTEAGYAYSGYPNFNCPDGIIPSLQSVGFDMLLTANNHTYDTQTTGFFRTQQVLQQYGLDYIGTKPDDQTNSFLVKDVNGIQVGMVCYTYETNSDPDRVALNGGANMKDNEERLINTFLKDDPEGFAADLEQDITAMKAAGAEAIVLFIHWGEEYQTKENSQQRAMAQAACDLGVDVIVGGHPHVIQPMDLLTSTDGGHNTVCLYSTGNALSNQRREHMNLKTGHTEDGIYFTFTFAKYSDGTVLVDSVELLPTWIDLRTDSSGTKVYDILPLDTDIADWKTQFGLSDSKLASAQASYERTMKIVGAGLEEVNAYLAAQIRPDADSVQPEQ